MVSFDAFISYAHHDSDFARQLLTWLRKCGFAIWFDEEQLIPGERFRVSLQQGLRESQHMIAILSKSYFERSWTQRELDLFDAHASHTKRRLLAIEIDNSTANLPELDQAFIIHQRIKWSTIRFDPEGFWKLYCGLTGRSPGSLEEWATKGHELIDNVTDSNIQNNVSSHKSFVPSVPSHNQTLFDLVNSCLNDRYWIGSFKELRRVLVARFSENSLTARILINQWAYGHAEIAAVLSLAMLPSVHSRYSVWPFVDLACGKIARWFLEIPNSNYLNPSEIWFSWSVFEEDWNSIVENADYAPRPLRQHFRELAQHASKLTKTFDELEADYDYGLMITPWNHFHLSWLAKRSNNVDLSRAHARALCNATVLGDLRTGRFINRLSTWKIFESIREYDDVSDKLVDARDILGLIAIEEIEQVRERLKDLWNHIETDLNELNFIV